MKKVLVADVGGTFTRLALIDESFQIRKKLIVPTENFSLDLLKTPADAICIAAAGPLIKGKIKLTHRNILLDQKKIEKQLKKKVILINDMIAWGNFIKLKYPSKDSCGIIALGTGFGLSVKIAQQIMPSEFAHLKIRPIKYYEEVLNKYSTYDQVLSGPGLEKIYSFYQKKYNEQKITSSFELHTIKNKATLKTYDLFVKVLTQAINEIAKIFVITEKVYLTGGVITHNYQKIRQKFIKELSISNTALKVVCVQDLNASLKGAAYEIFGKKTKIR